MPMRTDTVGININTQYRNENYNLGRDRAREKQHKCNAKKTPYFSKLELVDNTI